MSLGRRTFWLLLVLAVVASALVIACGEDKDEGGTPGAKATAGPATSAPTRGVTDTEIRIGTLLPLTGVTAAWGVPLSKGMKAYYDYINDQGGIYGRKIKFFVEDNGYSGPVAAEAARKLVEQDGVFLIQGSLGTAAHMAVYKYLEENNVIDYAILTGNSTWTDPVARTRFSTLVDYITEGRIFATYVYENYNGKKLGILAQNDDYGKEGERGVKRGLEENDADVDVTVEYYDESQTDVTAQVQRLRNEGVEVIVFWGAPVQAASLLKVARETLSWDVPIMINGTNAMEIVATLAGYDNIEGAVSAVLGRQSFETDIPFIAWLKDEVLPKYAPDVAWDAMSYSGMLISTGVAMQLKQAGPDLTVDSFVAAAESVCDWQCATCLLPAGTSPTDHRSAEADIMVKAVVDRSTDPPTFRWEPFGEPIGFESTTDCKQPTPPPGYDQQPGPSYYEEWDEDFQPYEP